MWDVAKQIFACVIATLVLLCDGKPSLAQTAPSDSKVDDERVLVDKWYAAYEEIINSIEVSESPGRSDTTPGAKAPELKRQTILTLNDSERGGRHGKVYLWTDQGRPVILSVIMSVRDKDVPGARVIPYEFNSLSQNSVTGSRFGTDFWRCEEPGVDWKGGLIDLVPSDSRVTRAAQMRTIARQFHCGVYEGGMLKAEFRLMPQPIYRYPDNTPGITDGAIFSFSIGTDPCIFLLVEARKGGWYVASSRSHAFDVQVRKSGETVWQYAPQANRNRFQTGAWYQKYTAERRAEDDPAKVLFSIWGNS